MGGNRDGSRYRDRDKYKDISGDKYRKRDKGRSRSRNKIVNVGGDKRIYRSEDGGRDIDWT